MKGELNIRNLLDLAEKLENMRPGEIKLLAWMDAAFAGIADQSRRTAMCVKPRWSWHTSITAPTNRPVRMTIRPIN